MDAAEAYITTTKGRRINETRAQKKGVTRSISLKHTLDGYPPLAFHRQSVEYEYLLLHVVFVAVVVILSYCAHHRAVPSPSPSSSSSSPSSPSSRRRRRRIIRPVVVVVAAAVVVPVPVVLPPPAPTTAPRDRLLLLPEISRVLEYARRQARLSVILGGNMYACMYKIRARASSRYFRGQSIDRRRL